MAVEAALRRGPSDAYDVVFADPPYPLSDQAVATDLGLLVAQGWLAEDALVVVERSARSPEPTWPAGVDPERSRTYGETVLWYGRATSEPSTVNRES